MSEHSQLTLFYASPKDSHRFYDEGSQFKWSLSAESCSLSTAQSTNKETREKCKRSFVALRENYLITLNKLIWAAERKVLKGLKAIKKVVIKAE